jgi:hypothetical protein
MAWQRSVFDISRNQTLVCVGLIVVFFLLLHAVDLWNSHTVLSLKGTDVEQQFYGWRDFGFKELREGRIPFWNPYVYGGAPFLAGMQSALFYPPHLLYLILPLPVAMDLLTVLHLIMGGVGFFYWARYRKLSHLYALAGGSVAPLCGVVYPHVLAGHLPNVSFLAWVPWWFYGLEKILGSSVTTIKQSLIAHKKTILGLSMVLIFMILGGHIQYLYYLLLGSGLYTIFQTLALYRNKEHQRLIAILIMLATGIVVGFALTAFQWMPMLFTLDETVRSRLSRDFAAMFSFPIENLITFVVPHFFGDIQRVSYWGRCYLWEMCLYFGIIPFIAFVLNLKKLWRGNRALLILAFVALVVALGKFTPLYDVLYWIVPGFASFRGVSKFSYLAIFPMLMLALHGLQAFSELSEKQRARYSRPLYILAAVLLLVGLLSANGRGLRGILIMLYTFISDSGESYFRLLDHQVSSFFEIATQFLSIRLIYVAVFVGVVAFLFHSHKILWKDRLLVLVGLMILDLVLFSRSFHATMAPPRIGQQAQALLSEVPEGSRIINLQNMNLGVLERYPDAWGNDPFVLRRYAEFMVYALGRPIEEASQYLPSQGFKFDPMHSQIRLYGIARLDGEAQWVAKSPYPLLPELITVSTLHIEPNINRRLARLKSALFNPWQEAIVEELPSGFFYKEVTDNAPLPKAEIIERLPGHYRIKVETVNPCLLILGTNYSKGWRAKGLPDSSQYTYTTLPANHTLLAIPINPGFHNIIVNYIAPGWNLGLWISSFVFLLIITLWILWGTARLTPAPATQSTTS